ncbi:glycosyl transferases group 1 domain-containing protein [Sarocladium implicatum]|nr:glycosyl transferases group 1 domain-containing protein [Sarocladium implicatum]
MSDSVPPEMAQGQATRKTNMALYVVGGLLCFQILFMFLAAPFLRVFVTLISWTLRKKTEGRKQQLMQLMTEEDKNEPKSSSSEEWEKVPSSEELKEKPSKSKFDKKWNRSWDGIVGFFHPFCNAGGGGERVLWTAIQSTQRNWPKAKCVVYTGDHDVTKDAILARVKNRFNIELHAPTITFLYLSKRHWVLASTWPRFTLLGQSLGSMLLLWDAYSLVVPDIFVDTMGYAFALGFSKLLFTEIPTGAYVHYPTISTDMLSSLDSQSADEGVNAGQGAGSRGFFKKLYWNFFGYLYSWVGGTVNVVMTNSSWTQNHIRRIWGPFRGPRKNALSPIAVVWPSVAVKELEEAIPITEASEKEREPVLVYIAQFRPEKNHELIVKSFVKFVKTGTQAAKKARLALIGSVRDDADSKLVYQLRLLVNELHIKDQVDFELDAPWPNIIDWLKRASVGVNGMWNEHFGIGVVEYQAAGLISVVHNSGGPKLDIVAEVDGEPTGFHATTTDEFAEAYEKALTVPNAYAMRQRARQSARRFTEEAFEGKWVEQFQRLVYMTKLGF